MKYNFFREFAMNNDQRNVFTESVSEKISFLPEGLIEFYSTFNTEDVIVTFSDLTSIKFYSIDDIREIQKEYNLPVNGYVFATYESDPIWIQKGAVYIGVHGANNISEKKISDSMFEFITSIVSNEVLFM